MSRETVGLNKRENRRAVVLATAATSQPWGVGLCHLWPKWAITTQKVAIASLAGPPLLLRGKKASRSIVYRPV